MIQSTSPPFIKLHMPSDIPLSDDVLFAFCQNNRELRLERTPSGELLIMSPTGGQTGQRNAELILQMMLWAKKDKSGLVFDSSTGFRLPNGAVRSPDASWVQLARLQQLTASDKQKFLPLCPDFLVELCSPSDDLSTIQAKMQEYIDAGAHLGWLIYPPKQQIWIYTTQNPKGQLLTNPDHVDTIPPIPPFTLDLNPIWTPSF
ncbi:MAG TPA: Uma2 family endonuclease [Anaerolineae bacterium]|nr:Uma2 family endonuclease [Anaerolineae bacterium]